MKHNLGQWAHAPCPSTSALVACLEEFTCGMRHKLLLKMREGRAGWDDPAWSHEDRMRMLRLLVEKGDMIDVANLAMFTWNQEPEPPYTGKERVS